MESRDQQGDLFNINGKSYNFSRSRSTSKTCNLDLRDRVTERRQGNKKPKNHIDTLCAKGTIALDFPSSLCQHRP